MRRRIIINIDSDDITEQEAVRHVLQVIDGGRISSSRGMEQFCFGTTFVSGIEVFAMDKRRVESDTFLVRRADVVVFNEPFKDCAATILIGTGDEPTDPDAILVTPFLSKVRLT